MATHHSTGDSPAFPPEPVPPSIPIRPAVIRGQLCFVVDEVAFTRFTQAACVWSAAESHRLDIVDQLQPPQHRCDDCQLHLARDVLRALGTCPRWGMVRVGVESRCPAFVAKDGAR